MDMRAGAGYAARWTTEGTCGEETVNEAEWLESPNPVGLLKHLGRARPYAVTARKMRLVACACLRRIWPMLSDKCRQPVEVAELHADRMASYGELEASNLRYAECSDDWFLAVCYAVGPNRSLRRLMESVFAYSTWALRGRFAGITGGDTLLGTAACGTPERWSIQVRSHLLRPLVYPPRAR